MGMGVLDLIGSDDYPPLAFTCPRCGADAQLRFAGPCPACVADLRARMAGAPRDVDTEYVPKMNVTPNAVAFKDD